MTSAARTVTRARSAPSARTARVLADHDARRCLRSGRRERHGQKPRRPSASPAAPVGAGRSSARSSAQSRASSPTEPRPGRRRVVDRDRAPGSPAGTVRLVAEASLIDGDHGVGAVRAAPRRRHCRAARPSSSWMTEADDDHRRQSSAPTVEATIVCGTTTAAAATAELAPACRRAVHHWCEADAADGHELERRARPRRASTGSAG